MEIEPETRGALLEAFRLSRGFTQTELTLATGISQAVPLLHQQGSWEPVTWTPDVIVSVGWPGTETSDIDNDLLHTMLLDGIVAQWRLADVFGVSTRQILRAIDATPPETGRTVKHVDWHQILPPHFPSTELISSPSRGR